MDQIWISENNLPSVAIPASSSYATNANLFVYLVENLTPGKAISFGRWTYNSGDKVAIADYQEIMDNEK